MLEQTLPVDAVSEAPPAPAPTLAARRKTSFGGDVLKLVTGTTIAQAIGILAMPLLTRLYSPEAFGTWALFTSITGIIGAVACLRYELAIMLPESDEEAANLLAVSLLAVVLVTGLTVPAMLFGGPVIMDLLAAPQLGHYLWLVPVAVFFGGAFDALNHWNTRTKHFGRLSIARLIGSASTQIATLGAGYAGYTTGGTQISTSVFGSAFSMTILGSRIWHDDSLLFRMVVRGPQMCKGARRYRNFPLYSTWAGLLNAVSVQLPTLLLSSFFSPTVVGFYALSHRVLTLPMSLIGGAIGQVFYQRAANAAVDGTLASVVDRTVRHLATLGLFPFLLLMLVGPDLFAFVFGEHWLEAGTYVQILAVWGLCVFLGSPVSSLNSVLEKQRVGLLFNLLQVATRVGSLIIGGVIGDITLALVLFSASGVITVFWFLIYHLKYSGADVHSLRQTVVRQSALAIVFLLPILILKTYVRTSSLHILIATVPLSLLYYILAFIQNDELLHLGKRLIGAAK